MERSTTAMRPITSLVGAGASWGSTITQSKIGRVPESPLPPPHRLFRLGTAFLAAPETFDARLAVSKRLPSLQPVAPLPPHSGELEIDPVSYGAGVADPSLPLESWEAFLERVLERLNRLYQEELRSDITILLRKHPRTGRMTYRLETRLHE